MGPIETGMAFLRGDESLPEIIVLAYGMEEGLGGFYRAMALETSREDVKAMFEKLAAIERRHKQRLFELYQRRETSVTDVGAFEAQILSKAMEGGLTTEEFMAAYRTALETVPAVLDLAMTIEAQALDLYLRYSERSTDPETRNLLRGIADEEKSHLAALGDLMDKS